MDAHRNFAISTVLSAPSPAASGTSLTVATGTGTIFPTPPFNATVRENSSAPSTISNSEIIRITAIVGDVFTIERQQESTNPRAIVAGDIIANTITAKTLEDIEQLAALINPDDASYRLRDGQLQLWDSGQSAWIAVGFNNGILVASDPISP